MKRIIFPVLAVATAIVMVILRPGLKEEGKSGDYLDVSGVVEATEVDLAPRVPGRIDWLCCSVGDHLKAGDTAFRLDDRELKATIEEARATVDLARASLRIAEEELRNAKILVKAARYELKAQKSEIERLAALTGDADRNLKRVEKLFGEGGVTERMLDEARTAYEANRSMLSSARARKKVLEMKLQTAMVNENVAEAKLAYARARLAERSASLDALKVKLDEMAVVSPLDGTVVYKAFERGEVVNAGVPVYTVHDLEDLWVLAEIEETEIGSIRLGAPAEVVAASIPGRKFGGTVSEIGRVGEFATQRNVLRGTSDVRTFRVKVKVDKPEGLLKSGMSVRVRIYRR